MTPPEAMYLVSPCCASDAVGVCVSLKIHGRSEDQEMLLEAPRVPKRSLLTQGPRKRFPRALPTCDGATLVANQSFSELLARC